jgi:signal transduction histidine kinase
LIVAGIALVLLLQQLLIAGVDSTQSARARDLAPQAQSGNLPQSIPGTGTDTSLVQVVSSGGKVVSSTANISGEGPILRAPPVLRETNSITISNSPLDTDVGFRVLAEPIALPDGPGWIYVASSLTPVTTAVRQLGTLFLVGLPVVVVFIAAIAWFTVQQSLKPVEYMRRRAAAITAADLSQRIPVPPGTDEIAALATTMNEMLARIERAANRQIQFMGDASHELRSPLAALQIQLDLAISQSGQDETPSELLHMREQVARMTMLIDDLLFLARSSESSPTTVPAPIDLDELVFEEAARLRALSGPKILTTRVSAARITGSRRDLARLLRNLGDNAFDHARQTVEFSVSVVGAAANLVVSDDGEGIPPSERERIFARFVRLDHSRVRDSRGGGSGLGLAIARTIVESAGGTIAARDRTDGNDGTEFVVHLPLDNSSEDHP